MNDVTYLLISARHDMELAEVTPVTASLTSGHAHLQGLGSRRGPDLPTRAARPHCDDDRPGDVADVLPFLDRLGARVSGPQPGTHVVRRDGASTCRHDASRLPVPADTGTRQWGAVSEAIIEQAQLLRRLLSLVEERGAPIRQLAESGPDEYHDTAMAADRTRP